MLNYSQKKVITSLWRWTGEVPLPRKVTYQVWGKASLLTVMTFVGFFPPPIKLPLKESINTCILFSKLVEISSSMALMWRQCTFRPADLSVHRIIQHGLWTWCIGHGHCSLQPFYSRSEVLKLWSDYHCWQWEVFQVWDLFLVLSSSVCRCLMPVWTWSSPDVAPA